MYTILDAIKDEIDLQQDHITAYSNMKGKDDAAQKELWQNIEKSIHYSIGMALLRIQKRVDEGYEFHTKNIDDHTKFPKVDSKKTNRHLEDRHEELRQLRQEMDELRQKYNEKVEMYEAYDLMRK